MRFAITGLGLWTAAGRGVGPALDLLDSGHSALCEPPWSAPLTARLAALVPGLERTRPAATLAEYAAREALATAGLDALPQGAGLVVATSTGDISGPWTAWHVASMGGAQDPEPPSRHGPTEHLREVLRPTGPVATVSLACASGTAALALATGWLLDGLADTVLVVGVDALSPFIHAGFDGLGALSPGGARPFAADRDGLTLGEGAGALVLETSPRAVLRGATILAEVRGAGLAADARHLTAPHREGLGAALGMERALADAGVAPEAVGGVSLHGTGTAFNDQMEARAVGRVFAGRPPWVHGVKHALGHTLGAAGAVEAVVAVAAMARGSLPPSPAGADPGLGLPEGAGPAEVVLCTNSAFGGANAAVVLTAPWWGPPPRREPAALWESEEAVVELPGGQVDLAPLFPEGEARHPRRDRYLNLGLLALARLHEHHPPTPDTALVLASPSGCRAVDLRYHRRLVERGLPMASRREFSYTIPYSPIAEASIRWGSRGALLATVGGDADAIDEARRLVRWGRATRAVALEIEAPGECSAGRAVCRLVSADSTQ